jgi:hypothetical protein
MTRAEKAYLDRVASLGCILCAEYGQPGIPAEIHHLRTGQGMGQRASSWLCVPLCAQCHRGSRGIHGDRSLLRFAKLEEMDLLAKTIERLAHG